MSDRATIWSRYGAPTDQVGSVNDPRSTHEFGVHWNEKWIYRAGSGNAIGRVILWNRYDLVGVFRIAPDGSATPEEQVAG